MPLCVVKTCKNRTRHRPIWGEIKVNNTNSFSYHRFPKDEKLKSLWADVIQLKLELIPNGARICSAHFTENNYKIVHGRRVLKPNALPYIERVIEDTENDIIMPSTSASDTFKVDRATSPIPGCSGFGDQSTTMSLKKEENSLENEYLKKQLQDTKKFYIRKLKDLQQHLRRKKSKIDCLKGMLNLLRGKLRKNRGISVNKQFNRQLRTFALTLHYYSPKAYEHVQQQFHNCLPYSKTICR